MLGWLIFFTFLTGMFAGSTLLFGAAIFLTQRSDQNQKTKANLEQHDEELENLQIQPDILKYT